MEMSEALAFQVYTLGASEMHTFNFVYVIHSRMRKQTSRTLRFFAHRFVDAVVHEEHNLHYLIIVGLI